MNIKSVVANLQNSIAASMVVPALSLLLGVVVGAGLMARHNDRELAAVQLKALRDGVLFGCGEAPGFADPQEKYKACQDLAGQVSK